MTPIRKGLLVLLTGFILGFFTGCATASKGDAEDANLIQRIFTKLLPADFAGPVHLEHRNQYFSITIDGVNVRQVDGRWTWDALSYARNSHFPLFSGVTWSSSGRVNLGPPIVIPPSRHALGISAHPSTR
jgi:hypothetical protein